MHLGLPWKVPLLQQLHKIFCKPNHPSSSQRQASSAQNRHLIELRGEDGDSTKVPSRRAFRDSQSAKPTRGFLFGFCKRPAIASKDISSPSVKPGGSPALCLPQSPWRWSSRISAGAAHWGVGIWPGTGINTRGLCVSMGGGCRSAVS